MYIRWAIGRSLHARKGLSLCITSANLGGSFASCEWSECDRWMDGDLSCASVRGRLDDVSVWNVYWLIAVENLYREGCIVEEL